MKLLAVVGSLRERSTSRYALHVAASGAQEAGADVSWLDLRLNALPICDGRDDPTSYGPEYLEVVRLVQTADALIVGSPEYYGSMPGALKNTYAAHSTVRS